jgi:hypothetical protein
MKRNLIGFLVLMLLIMQQSFSQQSFTVEEDFDGVNPMKFNVVQGTWVYNTDYYQPTLTNAAVSRSYLGFVPEKVGDTTIIQFTGSYNFSGYDYVQLRFNQICKVSPSDITKIQYKVGNNNIWNTITKDAYLGSATNYDTARGFNAASYSHWDADDSTAIPTQDWWKEEVFDMSVDLKQQNGVVFRFMIIHGDVPYTDVSFGWLLENIQLIAADYVIGKPIVEFLPPLVKDTAYNTGPFTINARVEATTDAPMEHPYFTYIVTEPGEPAVSNSILMTPVSDDSTLWQATIPQYIAGTNIQYSITGRDTNGNEATASAEYYIKLSCGGGSGSGIIDFAYTENVQTVTLFPGIYEFEVWGADGGSGTTVAGGRGGYSTGTVTLHASTTLYVVVGGKPTARASGNGGYNGGGTSGGTTGWGGGGATHISSYSGLLTDNIVRNNTLIVAGGGGGVRNDATLGAGGDGGGTTGGTGGTAGASIGGSGGTQTAGGAGGTGTTAGNAGSAGQGGNAQNAYAGAGGGGWYGGGSGGYGSGNTTSAGGGGGSGYISGIMNGVSAQVSESGFIANPVAEGNGFARITFISSLGECSDNAATTYSIDMPDTVTTSLTAQIPVVATVKNAGILDLDSVTVSYSVNGSTPVSTSWYFNPALPWDYSFQDTLGYYNPRPDQYDTIIVWVNMPNGQLDTNTFDDTLTKLIFGKSDILAAFIDPPADTVHAIGPYEIKTSIKSISGLSFFTNVSLNVAYTYDGVTTQDILDMQLDVSDSLWKASIPQKRFNNGVSYFVNLTDAFSNNITISGNYYIQRSCEKTEKGCDSSASVKLVSIDSPEAIGMLAGNNIPVRVTLQNKGIPDLDSCYINWSRNGVVQPDTTVYKRLPLATDFTDTITIGSYIPVLDERDTIIVWVSMPNGMRDSTRSDDTLQIMPLGCKTILSGEHLIGEGGTFAKLTDAIHIIRNCGASGNVTLQLKGNHAGVIDLSDISDYMGDYTLTITSYDNHPDSAIITATTGAGILLNKSDNIVINAITVNVSTGGIPAIQFTGACTNVVIRDCRLLGDTTTTTTGTANAVISKIASTGVVDSISFINNLIRGGYYGFYFLGGTSATAYGTNVVFDSNTVSHQYSYAFHPCSTAFNSVSHNTILSRTKNTTAIWYGMRLAYVRGDITGNIIRQCTAAITTPVGIWTQYYNHLDTNNGLIANNEIMIRTTSTTVTYSGIYVNSYTHADILHNSIFVGGTNGRGIHVVSSAYTFLNVKNNNIVMEADAAFPVRLAAVTNVSQWIFDYNNMFAPVNVGYATSAHTDIGSWQSVVTSDKNSKSIKPEFIDTTSLELKNSSGLLCNIIPPITHDIYNTPRIGITTMGCYDKPYNGNATLQEIVELTNDGAPVQAEDIKVIVYNTGAEHMTSVNLEWSVDGVSRGSNDYPVSLQKGDSTMITIGTLSNLNTNAMVKAWINMINDGSLPDEFTGDDTVSRFIVVCNGGGYGGLVKIGKSVGAFPTVEIAYQAMLTCGVSNDITVQFEQGTYTGTINLSRSSTLFGNHHLTITSSTGNAGDVTILPSSGAVIVLDSSHNVTIKGLTIDASAGTLPAIQFSGACTNVVVRDCRLLGNTTTTTSATTNAPVSKVASTGVVDSISFINNLIDGGYYGFYFLGGTSATAYGTNIVFDSNTLSNQYYYAFHPCSTAFNSCSHNTMISRDTLISTTWYGMRLAYVSGPITGNIIKQCTAAITQPVGIWTQYYNHLATDNGLIANNEIMIRTTSSTVTYSGIYVNTYTHADIINNSIFVRGTDGRGIHVVTSAYTFLNVKNNNIVMEAAAAFPIRLAAVTNLSQWDFDYNNMYAPTNTGYATSAHTSIAGWQSVVTSDKNSVSVLPVFVDSTTMKLSSYNDSLECLLNTNVPADIEGENRFSITTMGAYSKEPEGLDLRILEITPWHTDVIDDQTVQVSVNITNGSMTDVSSATFGWSLNGTVRQTGIPVPISPALGTFEMKNIPIDNFTVTNTADTFNVEVWIESVNGQTDLVNKNDTASASVVLMPMAEFTTPLVADTIGSLSFDVNVKIRDYTGAPVNTPKLYVETILSGSCYIHEYDTIPMTQENGKWVAAIPKKYYNSKVIYKTNITDAARNTIVLRDSTFIMFGGSGGGIDNDSNFLYTGDVQSVMLSAGIYEIECWGANGGNSNQNRAGIGGYSKGILTLRSSTILYIVVGGTPSGTTSGLQPGGYNGGGSGWAASTGRAGGGATHIAKTTGLLSSLESFQSDVLIVAGGGGGDQNAGTIGHGGGLSGTGTYPGTQTGSSGGSTVLAGSFGQGGNITSSYGGGGGGGWYGGGATQNNAGSGGSGYIGGVTNGITDASGGSNFVANPDPSGHGLVRITTLSGGGDVYIGNNLAIFNLLSPINNPDSICSPDYLPVQIALSNIGENDYDFTQDDITIGYEIINSRGTSYTGNIVIDTGGLFSGESRTVELMSNMPVLAGQYTIKAWVTSAIDNFICDDTLTTTYTTTKVGLPIQENFSNGIPAEFVPTSVNGTSTWEWYGGSAEIQPDSGTAMIRFNGTSGSRARLSTGQLDLYQAANPFVEFWYYHNPATDASDYSYMDVNIVINDATTDNLDRIYLRDPNGSLGWTHYRYYLNNYTTGNDCILVQFESLNRYPQTSQYIDYIQITSEPDAAVSGIVITPEPALCNQSGSDISVVIEAPRAQSMSFTNTDSLRLDIDGTIHTVSLQGKTLAGNSSDTIPVLSDYTIPIGITSMKAYFSSPVDNMPANDTAKHTIDIRPGINIRIHPISTSLKPAAAEFMHNQKITITNTGNVDIPAIGLVLTVDTVEGKPSYFTMPMTFSQNLAPGDSNNNVEFTGAFSIPWSFDYFVKVRGYLLCDPAIVDTTVSIHEYVDMNDLYMLSIENPLDNGEIDVINSMKEVSIKVKNRNLRKTYNPGEAKVVILITDTNGNPIDAPIMEELPVISGGAEVPYTFGVKYEVPRRLKYRLNVYIEKVDQYTKNDTLKMIRETDYDVSISDINKTSFTMEQNIPNPAKDNTLINYSIPQDGEIVFNVYSVSGQLLYSQKESATSGDNRIELNISDYASGVYFYTMEYKGQRITKRMSITR